MRLSPLFALALSSALGLGCSRSEGPDATAEAQEDPTKASTSAADPAPAERAEQPLGERARPPADPAPVEDADAAEASEDPRGSSRPAKRRAAATRDGGRVRAGDGEGSDERHAPEPGTAGVELSVKRLVIATNVVDREPVSASNVISQAATDKVFAFVEVDNPKQAETELSVMFVPPTHASFPVALSIGGLKRYRTWAYTRKLDEVGTWRVEVRSGNDVLATQSFQLTE